MSDKFHLHVELKGVPVVETIGADVPMTKKTFGKHAKVMVRKPTQSEKAGSLGQPLPPEARIMQIEIDDTPVMQMGAICFANIFLDNLGGSGSSSRSHKKKPAVAAAATSQQGKKRAREGEDDDDDGGGEVKKAKLDDEEEKKKEEKKRAQRAKKSAKEKLKRAADKAAKEKAKEAADAAAAAAAAAAAVAETPPAQQPQDDSWVLFGHDEEGGEQGSDLVDMGAGADQ